MSIFNPYMVMQYPGHTNAYLFCRNEMMGLECSCIEEACILADLLWSFENE